VDWFLHHAAPGESERRPSAGTWLGAEEGGAAMTSLSAVLLIDQAERATPRRATRVFPRLPAWLVEALNSAYTIEVTNHFGRRLRNLDDASNFLRVLERCFGCKMFDHCGSDPDQNLVSEPYAETCTTCRTAAAEFARRLGLRFTTSTTTHHAPGSGKCIRFTFFRSGVAR
jgi:hypothetical protein